MRNEALYKSLKAYCEHACELFRTTGVSQQPLGWSHSVTLNEKGLPSQGLKFLPPWTIWIHQASRKLADSDPMSDLNEVLNKEDVLVSQMKGDEERFAGAVLYGLLDRQHGWAFSPDTFNRLYEEVEEYLYSNTYTAKYVAPLVGFQLSGDRLEILPHLAIRRLAKEEKEEYFTFTGFFGASFISDFEFAIEASESKIKAHLKGIEKTTGNRKSAPGLIQILCTSMRLFKSGGFGYDTVTESVSGWSFREGSSAISNTRHNVSYWGEAYHLEMEEADKLRALCNTYINAPNRGVHPLDLALRGFNFAYERINEEDRLLDLVQAMEPILLDDDKELSYKFSLRGAYILGSSAATRESIFEDLRAGYGYRSHLTHGSRTAERGRRRGVIKVGGIDFTINELNLRLGDHLRHLIRIFLTLPNIKHFRKELDRAIARGVSPFDLGD